MTRIRLSIILLLLLLWSSLPVFSALAATDHSYPSVTAWPLATHSADATGSTTNLAFGILHHREAGSYERYAVRPWLFNLETDADRDSREWSLLFDLAHVERQGEDFRRHLFPVYWHGRDGKKQWFHLWPLYGQSEAADGARTISTLYPFFSLTRHPTTDDWTLRYLWPLGEIRHQGEERSSRFIPLWWRHETPQLSEGFLFPYLWRDHGESHTRAIVPIWWRQQSPEKQSGYFLLYAWQEQGEARHDLLIPLWWRYRAPEARFSLLVPLYFGWENSRGEGSVVLPLWYAMRQKESEFTTLIPFYLDWRAGTGNRLQLLLPFYGDHRSETSATRVVFPVYFRHNNFHFDSTLRYWFPLFGSYERGTETQRYYLFPLYAHMQDPQRGYDSRFFLWPLVHHETLPDARDTWVLPLFRSQRTADTSNSMAGLLWWSGQTPERDYTLLLPLYGHWRNPQGEYHVTPLSFDLRKPDGYRKRFFLGPVAIATEDPQQQRKQLDILWPLISRSQRGETSHSRALPFWWHDESPQRSFSLALLPPYLHLEEPGKSLFHLWPFYGRKLDGDFREDAVLWPFLRYGRASEGERRSWQAFLAFGSSDTDRSSFGLLPLWYHQRKNESTRDLSLLHWQERSPDASTFALLHLGHPDWSLLNLSQRPNSRHQHFFPLYSFTRTTTPESVRTWIIWPLYSYKRDEERTRHALLWKVLYRDSGPQKSETGFLWRFIRARQDAETSLFELNPFYYREAQVDASEQYIAWLGGIYATRTTGEGTEHRLFWFLRW